MRFRLFLSCSLLLLIPAAAKAATPSLGAIRPVGGQRGTRNRHHPLGGRAGRRASRIIYYQTGITTVSLKKVDDNNVKARIKIAADCAWVCTTSG